MAESARRRTKIVATVGPASRQQEVLTELIEAGADVLRLNFSHGSRAEHAENIERIRAASDAAGRSVGILGDLPGPKLRIDEVEDGIVTLHQGGKVEITSDEVVGTAERLPVSWEGLTDAIRPGDPVFLADGRVRLRADDVTGHSVHCTVEAGGAVSSHQGLNLPGAVTGMPSAGAEDIGWIDFAVEHEVDLLALSFVRSADDLRPVQDRIRERGADIPLIAKIEKPQAAESVEEIVAASGGGIMVARGDLGIELPIESVPVVQKRLLKAAGKQAKPAITATQMLASMVRSDRPTRAEVTDVANAIYDGTDAVMLSEETAIGDHPVEAVRVMDRIARETETDLPYGHWLLERVEIADDIAASVAQGAVGSTYRLGLKAIVVPTRSGRTARYVSAYRPQVPVLAVSPRRETVRRLNLLFGVQTAHHDEWEGIRDLLDDCAEMARECGVAASGDMIAITAGLPQQELGTNLFEIHRVP